jgi:Na+/citrate or Na+/malate symporter
MRQLRTPAQLCCPLGINDVAILATCDCLQLMPFAQISTRIGGAAAVTLALVLLRVPG